MQVDFHVPGRHLTSVGYVRPRDWERADRVTSNVVQDALVAALASKEMEDSIVALPPMQHRSIRGTGGIRKLRWAGSGRGKQSGVIRVVFYQAGPDVIYLLTAYAKADREDLTPADSKALTRLVAAIKKELQGK